LLNRLRAQVGQDNIDHSEDSGVNYNTTRPEWFIESQVVNSIDIREMLNRGEHPVHEVLSAIKKLDDKEILEIIAPFIPAPLLDKTMSLNYKHWLDKRSAGEFAIYFTK